MQGHAAGVAKPPLHWLRRELCVGKWVFRGVDATRVQRTAKGERDDLVLLDGGDATRGRRPRVVATSSAACRTTTATSNLPVLE